MCSVLFTDNRKGQVELPEILHRSTQPQILESICKFGRLGVNTLTEDLTPSFLSDDLQKR